MSEAIENPEKEIELPSDPMEESPKADQATRDDATAVKQEEDLSDVKKKLDTEKDRFLRLFADFENYKRRTAKERIAYFETANANFVKSLLPVLDDFDRGLKEIEKSTATDLLEGVQLIHNKLKETLKNEGLEEIVVQPGDTFDADHHEAITQIAAPTEDLKGKIVDIIEKGYKLGEKVIRYPKVVTGS